MPVIFKTIKKFPPPHHPHWVAWLGIITVFILGFGVTTQFLLSTTATSTIITRTTVACPELKAGDRFKVAGFNAVYLLNENRARLYFPSSDVYHTWFENFTGVTEIAPTCVDNIPLPGRPPYGVNYRPGSRWVKLRVSPSVYVIEPGNRLARLGSEEVARQLYGEDWRRLVRDLSDELWPNFVAEDPAISEPKPHDGMIVTAPNDATAYYVQNGRLRPLQGNLLNLDGIRIHTLPATVFAALEKSSSSMAAREIPDNPTQATVFVERINALPMPSIPGAVTSTATTTVITTPIATTTLPVKPPITPTTTTTAPPVLVTAPPATPANPIAPPPAASPASSTQPTTTTTPSADATPPIISSISVSGITSNSVIVTWTTNEPSNSRVNYGLTSSYGSASALNTSLVTTHSVSLTNLSSSTTYQFQVVSADAAGNSAAAAGQSGFTTSPISSPPPDSSAKISCLLNSNAHWCAGSTGYGYCSFANTVYCPSSADIISQSQCAAQGRTWCDLSPTGSTLTWCAPTGVSCQGIIINSSQCQDQGYKLCVSPTSYVASYCTPDCIYDAAVQTQKKNSCLAVGGTVYCSSSNGVGFCRTGSGAVGTSSYCASPVDIISESACAAAGRTWCAHSGVEPESGSWCAQLNVSCAGINQSTPPPDTPPPVLDPITNSSTSVYLRWSSSVNADKFQLFRQTAPFVSGFWDQIGLNLPGGYSGAFTDSVSAGQTYQYYASACKPICSAPSNYQMITVSGG